MLQNYSRLGNNKHAWMLHREDQLKSASANAFARGTGDRKTAPLRCFLSEEWPSLWRRDEDFANITEGSLIVHIILHDYLHALQWGLAKERPPFALWSFCFSSHCIYAGLDRSSTGFGFVHLPLPAYVLLPLKNLQVLFHQRGWILSVIARAKASLWGKIGYRKTIPRLWLCWLGRDGHDIRRSRPIVRRWWLETQWGVAECCMNSKTTAKVMHAIISTGVAFESIYRVLDALTRIWLFTTWGNKLENNSSMP